MKVVFKTKDHGDITYDGRFACVEKTNATYGVKPNGYIDYDGGYFIGMVGDKYKLFKHEVDSISATEHDFMKMFEKALIESGAAGNNITDDTHVFMVSTLQKTVKTLASSGIRMVYVGDAK